MYVDRYKIYTDTHNTQSIRTHAYLDLRVKGALQLLINRYGQIRFAQVPERVSTESVVVLIIENSKSFHLGAQSTFNPSQGSSLPSPNIHTHTHTHPHNTQHTAYTRTRIYLKQ